MLQTFIIKKSIISCVNKEIAIFGCFVFKYLFLYDCGKTWDLKQRYKQIFLHVTSGMYNNNNENKKHIVYVVF